MDQKDHMWYFLVESHMNRFKSFDQKLSKRLQNPRLARSFLLTLIEGQDGLSVEDGLKQMIRRMGIKEYAELIGIAAPHVSRMLHAHVTPTRETLDRYLAPLGLHTKLILQKNA